MSTPTHQASVTCADDHVSIFIDHVLHLKLRRSLILAIQGWNVGNQVRKYTIEFTMVCGSVKSEYRDELLWRSILAQLDEQPIFIEGFES